MTPLVLLPGMMCDARLFHPQIAALSQDRTLHLASITAQDSIADLAAATLAQAPPHFALCGLSMGGIVAMEILRQAPERVERLALLDTNPLAETEEVRARRVPQMAAVAKGHLAQVMRDDLKPAYLAETPRKPAILDLCMDMALSLGQDVFLRQSRALMSRPDQSDTLRHAQQPALILCGREDALCPVARHELMARLMPAADLVIIDTAGHLPTLEQPDRTTAALKTWLDM